MTLETCLLFYLYVTRGCLNCIRYDNSFRILYHVRICSSLGYRFTKELTQSLNLRKYVKLEYNINSLNYIQQN